MKRQFKDARLHSTREAFIDFLFSLPSSASQGDMYISSVNMNVYV